jgi:hypothetical protein
MAIDVGGAELDSWAAVCSNPVDSVLMRGCRGLVIGTGRSLFAKEIVSVHVSAEAKRIQREMWKLSGGLCRRVSFMLDASPSSKWRPQL